MGVVYSPQKVELGHIPEEGAHEQAGTYMLDRLFSDGANAYQDNTGVYAGLVFGSAALRTAGVRSDLDVLVRYDSYDSAETLTHIGEAIVDTEKKYKVSVGVTTLHREAFDNSDENMVDPGLATHLYRVKASRPDLLRADPLGDGLIEQGLDRPLWASALHYNAGKLRIFSRSVAESMEYDEAQALNNLQRAFELPAALSRKMLPVLWGVEGQGALPEDEDKNRVLMSTLDHMAELQNDQAKSDDTRARTLELVDLNIEYSEILSAAMNGELSINEYREWIFNAYRPSCFLAHDVAYRWINVLKLVPEELRTKKAYFDEQL